MLLSTELPKSFNLSGIQSLPEFTQATKQILTEVNFSLLKNNSQFSLENNLLNISLDNWEKDPQHGIEHSFHVYQLMRDLRKKENFQVSDEQLFIRAVLHDLAEFLPFKRSDNQEIPQDERSSKHQKLMKTLIKVVGKNLNIEDKDQLALDIYHHDDFYLKPSQKEMERLKTIVSPAGQLLADADRLVFDAQGSIDRNRKGSLGRWYFFRQDLANDERNNWKPRTGGLFDGFSALALEFVAPEWRLYTKNGAERFSERKKNFKDELYRHYSESYQYDKQLLERAQNDGWQIQFGLKNKEDIIEIPEVQRQATGFDELNLSDKIKMIITIPVVNKSTEERKYFGYSVCVTDPNGKKYWLDPSILVFENVEQLQETFNNTIDTFTPTPLSPAV